MNLCVIIPVHGRLSLLAWTLDRLLMAGHKVVLVGNDFEAEDMALTMGADWVWHPNRPLGTKLNAGWRYAMEVYDPDFYLMGNASDWYSSGYLDYACSQVGNYGGFAVTNKYYLNFGRREKRLVDNLGSVPRSSGLVLTREVVRDFDGEPFNGVMDSDLDWSVLTNVKDAGYQLKVYRELDHKVLSISFYKWLNAYSYEGYWHKGVRMGDGRDWLREYFPDAMDMTLW